MRTLLTVAVAVSVCILVGWLAWPVGDIAAQTQQPQPNCHYEVYGAGGSEYDDDDDDEYGPVILLNQCTGDTWQLIGSGTRRAWRSLGTAR